MKKKLSVFLSVLLALSMILPMAVMPAAAEETTVKFEIPESPSETYNMNLDWRFFDTKCTDDIWTALTKADNNGKHFFENGYAEGQGWETVSIPHGIGGGTNSFTATNYDAGGGYRSVLLYRKEFTVPASAQGGKVFFELEGIRQSAYVWVNGQEVGYYEAGITAMGFDITSYVTPGQTAVIAICNDGATGRGTSGRIPYETVPGQTNQQACESRIARIDARLAELAAKDQSELTEDETKEISSLNSEKSRVQTRLDGFSAEVKAKVWGSSYTPDNYKTTIGGGAQFVWNTKDFNEPMIGLVYDAYLHVKGNVYQTLPLYNNLKTTGNYIYADNFDIRGKTATIHVDAEVRNESAADGNYTLEVAVVDEDGNTAVSFSSQPTEVTKATDAGDVYETTLNADAYTPARTGITIELDGVSDQTLLAMINDASKRPPCTENKDTYYTYAETWSDWADIPSGFTPTQTDSRGYRYEYRDNGKDKNIVSYDSGKAGQYRLLQKVTQTSHLATEIDTPDVTYITASGRGENLRFWSTDDPYLYTVYTILKDSAGKIVDMQEKQTGFRKITYDANSGILINDKAVWMPGYAQRSTNEWAVIGAATDWLQDYDMQLLKENNSNFIRWMHVAPKPNEVRSSDKYGVAVVSPAGDKEGVGLTGRQWVQRVEAMRDVMIYFRNSPSVIFWETGNSAVGYAGNAVEMADMRDALDPNGMRFIGARSTLAADQMNYDYNYAGTMYGTGDNNKDPKTAIAAMKANGKMGPIMETEYARDEAPRRVWDRYSPPDFDYVNKYISKGGKSDGYDVWNETQEEASIANIREYNGYYSNRAGYGANIYSAAAMMVWSDSNMHTRNTATENDRTTGRVDAVRQTKEMFEVTKTAQSPVSDVHIVGHWSYPEKTSDNYKYYGTTTVKIDNNHNYEAYDKTQVYQRKPESKTVYVIGSADVSKVELYRIDKDEDGNESEIRLGVDEAAENNFIYQFDGIDVTHGDAVVAKAYDARGTLVKEHRIDRTKSTAAQLKVTAHTALKTDEEGNAVSDFRADGADIVYFDVQVLDENGRVCALNYDKINFEYTGDAATYLGGYNSGNGSGCFQNTMESDGISFYFGGAKDGKSVIGQNYVYAENGTARIFARATRTAGSFTLTAKMDGILPASATVTSTAVETTNGLTTQKPPMLPKGVVEAPQTSSVAPMMPLMLKKKIFDWSKVVTVEEVDTTKYYDIYIDGTKLEVPDELRAREKTMGSILGPLDLILQQLLDNGASTFTMNYRPDDSPATLTVRTGGTTYEYADGRNQVLIGGTEWDETVFAAYLEQGTLMSNISQMLGYIEGISIQTDGDKLLITHQ